MGCFRACFPDGWRGGRVRVDVDPEHGADIVVIEPFRCTAGGGGRHGLFGVGLDQFLVVDAAQREEQFGLVIQREPTP